MSNTANEAPDDVDPRYGGDWPGSAMLLSLALWLLAVIAHAAALKTLWQWFIVKDFNAPPLGSASAVGLMCISFLFGRASFRRGTFRQDLLHLVLSGFVVPLLAVAMGWVAHRIAG